MPEIKNTFRGGRMNKDLDERLVPPGEYRDALNVSVGRSEGSDVGALENLRGNELIPSGTQTITNTVIITPEVPAVPDMTTVVDHAFNVVSYADSVDGVGPGLNDVEHDFDVFSYTPHVPEQSGQPASATQTLQINAEFSSANPTASEGGSDNGLRGALFGQIVGALIPAGSTMITVSALQSGAGITVNPNPQVGDVIVFGPLQTNGAQVQIGLGLDDLIFSDNLYQRTIIAITETSTNQWEVTLNAAPTTSEVQVHVFGPTPASGGINYTLTAGSLFDQGGFGFLFNEQVTLTDPDGEQVTITFIQGTTTTPQSQGEDLTFSTNDTFNYPSGTIFTFPRYYEFAGGLLTYVSTVNSDPNNFQVELNGPLQVGHFYGYSQPGVIGDTILPHVTALNGNVATLSFQPPQLGDISRSGVEVYDLVWIGGGDAMGTPAVPASIVVGHVIASNDDPMVNESVVFQNSQATITAVEESGGQFTLTLNEDLTPNPGDGDNVHIVRQEVTDAIPAVPTTLVVTKTDDAHDDPSVGEEVLHVSDRSLITGVAVGSGQYTLTLGDDLTPTPTQGQQVRISRSEFVPGTPRIPAVTETTTETISIIPDTAKTIGSIRDNNTDKIYWFITSDGYDAIFEYDQADGSVVPIIRGDLNFSADNLITGINVIDEMIYWTDDVNEPRKLNINKWRDAIHSVIPTSIYGRAFTEADITVIKPHPKERIQFITTEDVDNDKPPFEEIFPQFAYRWKYDDGEYSPFSFFTEPAFIPGPYDTTEHYKEGYNKAVRNTITEVSLSNIPKGTPDVIEVDILYTESISATVYSLRTIRKNSDEWGTDPNYITTQTFNKRSFYSTVPGNQLTRPFDNVPRAAKSQEITANRLIYGNYLHNFPQEKMANISVVQRDNVSNSGLSVKGSRDYEVGVVYEDQFGRQGAMITGQQSSYTTRFNSRATQQLEARIMSDAPDWATHFKYFVKDPSMDHHNFPVYNTFNDGEADKINSEFVWLQIASDDRNKVSQDTFLVPRRHTHGEIAGAGVNTQGAGFVMQSQTGVPANISGTSAGNGTDYIAWVSGGSIPPGRKADVSSGTGLVVGGNAPENMQNGVYVAPADGEYTFIFRGEVSTHSETRFASKNNARTRLGAAFQVQTAGSTTFQGRDFINSTLQEMRNIDDNNVRSWSDSFGINYTVDLNEGDMVRPVIIQSYRRRTAGDTRLNVNYDNFEFETLVTPTDPDAPAPPLELPGFPFEQFSRHKVIEIENEAPDIVRNQLPIEIRALGQTVDYGLGNGEAVLTTGFNQPETQNVPQNVPEYTSSSTELFYEAGNEHTGYQNYSFISAINLVLDRAGEPRLRVSEGIPKSQLAGDEIISVDVSGVEGGIWFGVGAVGTSTGVGTDGKIRVDEISIGFVDEDGEVERSVIRIALSEPIGIDPNGMDWGLFKGDITNNALKNLIGTFFVKVPRATGNDALPFIPTGQSVFDDENNISTLQTIWFETIPELPDSNLDLYWEASESIPIAEHGERHLLDFYNCVALVQDDHVFLETQRIFDRFNSVQMVKGVRANVPQENYNEERRKYGLTWSGIYNSRTGINRLNQFIQADGITKELEPNYGGIQKLHTRDTNVVVFCEDKIFRILADKDLLFNADGGGNVSASNAVLGQTTPFTGEYGISLNPESFATYGSRIYFADRNRGVILRLSQDGLTEITNGMSDFFRDLLAESSGAIWGSYDDYTDQYNITFGDYTVSYSEDAQGWPSRKSFVPESGLTLNNRYYTFKGGKLWVHNSKDVNRNNFYGEQYNSSITTIFNQEPSSIKNYKTINYEGTPGWTAPIILTDQEFGSVTSFQNKEGKWFECIGVRNNEDIVSVIDEVGDLGPIDFFDEDAMNDGDPDNPFDNDGYDFNDDYTDGDDSTDDTVDSDMPDGPMGLGDAMDVTDGDGGEPQDQGGDDPNNPIETTITFNIE